MGRRRFVFWHGSNGTTGTNLSVQALTWEPFPSCSQQVCRMLRTSPWCYNHLAVCLSLRRQWSCWADGDEGMGAPFPAGRSPSCHICSSQQHPTLLCLLLPQLCGHQDSAWAGEGAAFVLSHDSKHFQWNLPFWSIFGGGMFTSDTQENENFAVTKGGLPWSSQNGRWGKPCKLPLQSSGYSVMLWLCGCAFTLGPSRVQRSLDAQYVLALPQGWMTFRNPFQPLFLMVLW